MERPCRKNVIIGEKLKRVSNSVGELPLAVDIEIDEVTPCLIRRISEERFETEVRLLTFSDLSLVSREAGWIGFDWKTYLESSRHEIYKLHLQGDALIQGLICLELQEGWVEVHLIENAPWNIGTTTQEFRGVGAHLFAIACRRSYESGCGGFVAFQAKSGLVAYYMRSLGAEQMGKNRLYINSDRSRHLVDTYFAKR